MVKMTKRQKQYAMGATALGVGYYLMSRPAGAESATSNSEGDAIRRDAYQRKVKDFDLMQGLGHLISKGGRRVKRGTKPAKKMVPDGASRRSRGLPISKRRGKSMRRSGGPAKKGRPQRHIIRPRSKPKSTSPTMSQRKIVREAHQRKLKEMEKPASNMRRRRPRAPSQRDMVAKAAGRRKVEQMLGAPPTSDEIREDLIFARAKYGKVEMPLKEFENMYHKWEKQTGSGRGPLPLAPSRGSGRGPLPPPKLAKRNPSPKNMKVIPHRATPSSIRNRLSHSMSGSDSYLGSIEPNFSVGYDKMQKMDAIRNADLLGYSGMDAGTEGDWFLE